MGKWRLSHSKLKQYPHFDKPLSIREAIALATDPQRVRSHGFFPFIQFEKRWTRFRRDGEEKRPKTRFLRYAARGDSYIYSCYRSILSERYEEELRIEQLTENVIAYRKIPVEGGRQLCSPADFRLKVANDGPYGPKLISRNKAAFGIPQGAAISDLLANAYLFEFDVAMAGYAKKHKVLYRRYSDDILMIVPGDGRAGRAAREYACKLIRKFGDQLQIKQEKSSTIKFIFRRGVYLAERIGKQNRVDGL